MVRFPLQEGTVIFTSFHNEKQNNQTELKLLKYLVFTAVTANVQSRTERSMGGFSKSRDSLISVSQPDASFTRIYRCDARADLRFVLGFENQGAVEVDGRRSGRPCRGGERGYFDAHHRRLGSVPGRMEIHGHGDIGPRRQLPFPTHRRREMTLTKHIT